jgi:hypothetical protein
MKKKQIQGLDLVLVAVSLALVVALIGAVGYIVFLPDETFKSTPNEVEPQPPMPAIPPYSDVQTLTEEEKSTAIELAINDPEVKKWLGERYEIYGVIPLSTENESSGMCMVYILTQKQKLPWVLGITLGVPVDLVRKESQGGCINFELELAPLADNQKEEVLRIALADPEVLEMIGDEEYEIQDVRVEYWESSHKGKSSFHAYPAVSMNVNPDPKLTGIFAIVYVDLESKKVVEIMSIPRKRAPSLQATPVSQEQAKEIAESKFNEVKAQTEPVECEELWKNPKAMVGTPFLVRTVDEKPFYWKVPVVLNEKVMGFVDVEMNGKVPRYGCRGCLYSPYYDPDNINNCSSTVTISTIEEAKELAKNITDKYSDAVVSEPIYVYDDTGCCSGEAWMLKIEKDGKIISRAFVSGYYAYERK